MLGSEEGARGTGAGRPDRRTRLVRGGGGVDDDSETNKNKSLGARPPHSTPGRPAVTVTCLPSGGNVRLSSSSSSPEPGSCGSFFLPSFPVPPPPPPWEPWTHNREVVKLLQMVRDKGRLCGVELRRVMRKVLMEGCGSFWAKLLCSESEWVLIQARLSKLGETCPSAFGCSSYLPQPTAVGHFSSATARRP